MSAARSTLKNQQSAILWVVLPSALLVFALAFDLLPFLRGNDEWRWPLRPIEPVARLILPIVLLGLYVLLCACWLRGFGRESISRRSERFFLLVITFAAPIIQLALAFAVSRAPLLEFFGPTVSTHNSGYFTTAISTPDLNQLLANFPALMPQLPIHVQSHPPGAVMAQWLAWQFFRALPPLADAIALPLRTLQCHNPGLMALDNAQIASATIGMLLPLIGALAVWPLYAFAKRVTSPVAAALTVMVFPLLPLFAIWMSQWDQIYPLLLFTGLYFAHTGLVPHPAQRAAASRIRRERNSVKSKDARSSTTLRPAQNADSVSWWRIFLAGVPLSLATFFSVGNFVLIVIVGLYGAARLWFQRPIASSLRRSISQSLIGLIVYALGCASVWLAYALFYGISPLAVISTGSRLAFESTTGNRSYGAWLLGNPIDFAVFLGFPIVALLLYNLIRRTPFPQSLRPITLAAFGTLIPLWLSGFVRGEVGRLWMYFGPLVVLIAMAWQGAGSMREDVTQHASRITRHALRFTFCVSLLALLALQLLIMNTRWLVNDSFLDEPPERSFVMSPPQFAHPVSASFANQMALRGYDAQLADDTLDLTLYWQALAQPPHAYTVFVHVLDRDGRQIGQQDNMPVHDQLPTSCWQPGEYVSDPYVVQLADASRGPYQIEIGLYRGETGARLLRSDAQGDSVTLEAP